MVELRQRVLSKNKSPPEEPLKNGELVAPTPRRSSRRVGADLEENKNDQRLKATYKNGIITIHGLSAPDVTMDEATATDNDSQEASMTWEDRWLESPSKRRKLERSANSPLDSPVKDLGASPLDEEVVSNFPQSTNPHADKSEEEQARTRRGRLAQQEQFLSRSRTSLPRYPQPGASTRSRRAASTGGSPRDLSEVSDHPQLLHAKESFDGPDNFSSARSTPVHAMSPAQSLSPTPGPPEQDDIPSGDSNEPKDPNQLDEQDLPPPFLPFNLDVTSDQFQDEAAYLLSKLFPPMSQPHRFIRALTSHSPSDRSTETLLALARNTQKALKTWQDEYLRLDKKTAPVSIPIPKKPATGGRLPVEPAVFEAEKQKELYGEGSVLASAMGIVHAPVGGKPSQAPTSHASAGPLRGTVRELRKRKGEPGVVDGLGISSDDAGGRTGSKRTRRPARRFEIGQNAQEAPEPEPVVAKVPPGRRRRRAAQSTTQKATEKDQNVRGKRGRIGTLLREESVGGSSTATPEAEDERNGSSSLSKIASQDVAQSIESRNARPQAVSSRSNQQAANKASVSAGTGSTVSASSVSGKVPIQANTSETAGPSGRRQKAKSEKRSESMTLWWAQRKKKAAEEKMRQMRERGELYGPTEGIMDTSEPINIGINKKRNAAAMNAQANATTAPSAAANKNFHARPMSMSMSHNYPLSQPPQLPPIHHSQQPPGPPPPGSGYMFPNQPIPGTARNYPWPQAQQPFHMPHPQPPQGQESVGQPGRPPPFSHFPPPPPDHAVLGGRGPPPPPNYPSLSYHGNNPPASHMHPPPGPHGNTYQHPYGPGGGHHSSNPPSRSPIHPSHHPHHPPPLLPPPTPSQLPASHQQSHEHSRNPSMNAREGDPRSLLNPHHPPPPPASREESVSKNLNSSQAPPPYHHPHPHPHPGSGPGPGPVGHSPPGRAYSPSQNHQQAQYQHQHQHQHQPHHHHHHHHYQQQHQQQHQQQQQQQQQHQHQPHQPHQPPPHHDPAPPPQHNHSHRDQAKPTHQGYMHVQQLPLAAAPSGSSPPRPASGSSQPTQMHPQSPNQPPPGSPRVQDQQQQQPQQQSQSQQAPLPPTRPPNQYYPMAWAGQRFGRY